VTEAVAATVAVVEARGVAEPAGVAVPGVAEASGVGVVNVPAWLRAWSRSSVLAERLEALSAAVGGALTAVARISSPEMGTPQATTASETTGSSKRTRRGRLTRRSLAIRATSPNSKVDVTKASR
jgi:hypothetical protein